MIRARQCNHFWFRISSQKFFILQFIFLTTLSSSISTQYGHDHYKYHSLCWLTFRWTEASDLKTNSIEDSVAISGCGSFDPQNLFNIFSLRWTCLLFLRTAGVVFVCWSDVFFQNNIFVWWEKGDSAEDLLCAVVAVIDNNFQTDVSFVFCFVVVVY